MTICCCPHAQSASRIFSRIAPRYRRRFERHGLERSQRQLLEGLRQAGGFEGASVLEVGSGVGQLHQTLLERGAAAALGVDLAPRMIQEARDRAAARGLAARTHYLEGDFVALAEGIEPAEVTLLDKVVCCYPDAAALVRTSLARTRRVYALTYPRERWDIRLGAALGAAGLRLLGSAFRPYVHSAAAIERWCRAAGFEKRYETHTFIWLTQVYVRGGEGARAARVAG